MDEFSRNGQVLEDVLFITLHNIAIYIQTGCLQYTHHPPKVDVGYIGYTQSVRLSIVGFSICLFVDRVSGAYRIKYWPSSFVTWYTHLHMVSLLTDPFWFLSWLGILCPLVGQNTVKGNSGEMVVIITLGSPLRHFQTYPKKYQLTGFIAQYTHLYNDPLDA